MIKRFGDGRDWFFEKRYGMFIHWGLYSIPAWHEQLQWRGSVPRAEYVKYMDQFNPQKFDPAAWLDLAQEAGMEYIVLTTKHHDGFCLWDTAQTDFNAVKSPYGKDIVKMLADECHKRSFPLGLYYSCVDWHHPNYPNEGRHHELSGPEPGDEPNMDKYMEFLKLQIRELCTNYGEIHEFWWDMNVPELKDPSVNAIIRELQPKAIINNRGYDDGDFGTPEREFHNPEAEFLEFSRPTESCDAVGANSWGYRKDEDYHSLRYLMQKIDTSLSKGGNFLLNVGPKADGTINKTSSDIILNIGKWFSKVKESYYGATSVSDLTTERSVYLTRKGNSMYVHLSEFPSKSSVLLIPISTMPKSATLLNNGNPVKAKVEVLPGYFPDGKEYLRLTNLPVNEYSNEVLVVKLDFDEFPKVDTSKDTAEFFHG